MHQRLDREEKLEGNRADPGRPTRRERERKRHRDEILLAASEEFARNGYDRTSMQQIADRAELSVGNLYTHFDGKEAIYREVLEFHLREMGRLLEEACLPAMSPLEKIRARLGTAISYFERHGEFIRLYHQRNESCRDEIGKAADEEHSRIFAGLIAEAIEQGELETCIDPLVLATMMEGAGHRLLELSFEDKISGEEIPDLLDGVFLRPFETGGRRKGPESGKDDDKKKEIE